MEDGRLPDKERRDAQIAEGGRYRDQSRARCAPKGGRDTRQPRLRRIASGPGEPQSRVDFQ